MEFFLACFSSQDGKREKGVRIIRNLACKGKDLQVWRSFPLTKLMLLKKLEGKRGNFHLKVITYTWDKSPCRIIKR